MGAPSGGAPTGAGRSVDEPAGRQFLCQRGISVQGSQGGKGGGLRQPRVRGRRSSLRGGLGQANMKSPGGFERAASEAGVPFHAADDGPASVRQEQDALHKRATGKAPLNTKPPPQGALRTSRSGPCTWINTQGHASTSTGIRVSGE